MNREEDINKMSFPIKYNNKADVNAFYFFLFFWRESIKWDVIQRDQTFELCNPSTHLQKCYTFPSHLEM